MAQTIQTDIRMVLIQMGEKLNNILFVLEFTDEVNYILFEERFKTV